MNKSSGHPYDVGTPSLILSPARAESLLGLMLRRVHDWRHERYIHRLAHHCKAAHHANDRVLARVYWRLGIDAINARSPAQVERMERRMGLFGVRGGD